MKYMRTLGGRYKKIIPEDIENLQCLETLDVRGTNITKLPACIIKLQRLVRLYVPGKVRLPDGIGNLQALEELSEIDFGIQSVQVFQELCNLSNLKVLETYRCYPTEVRDVEGQWKACVSSLSKLFSSLRELYVEDISYADLTFMDSCVPTPPPLRRLVFGDLGNITIVPHHISSLVNLTRLSIGLRKGELSKDGINILASLPMLLSLTVYFWPSSTEDILHPRDAISSHGFQRLVKLNFSCWLETALEFEPGAMQKLQRLKLRLEARCQFKYGQDGRVLGLQNLAGLKHVVLDIDCYTATADEVLALEDDIRGAAGAHPNRPILLVDRALPSVMA